MSSVVRSSGTRWLPSSWPLSGSADGASRPSGSAPARTEETQTACAGGATVGTGGARRRRRGAAGAGGGGRAGAGGRGERKAQAVGEKPRGRAEGQQGGRVSHDGKRKSNAAGTDD